MVSARSKNFRIPDGGITLAHNPNQITLLQVVEQFEGTLTLSDCVLHEGDCPFELRCPVNCQWIRLRDLIRKEMASVTFEQLVKDGKQLEANPLTTVKTRPVKAGKSQNFSYTDSPSV